MGKTLIQVSDLVWVELNRMKNQGETFDDVLRRVLKLEKKEK